MSIFVDEGFYQRNTTAIPAIISVTERCLIVASSTEGKSDSNTNPVGDMVFNSLDPDGLPTQLLVFTRRCSACNRLHRRFCPHVIETTPWQNDDDESTVGERDVKIHGPPGPLISPSARARILETQRDIGAALARAPIVIGVDPGGGKCYSAAVALQLCERGAGIVGVCASARPGREHLNDAARFVVAVAQRYSTQRAVVVYIETNLEAAAGKIADEIMEHCPPSVMQHLYFLRSPNQPVIGMLTGPGMPSWFAGMVHLWVETQQCVALRPDLVALVGDASGAIDDGLSEAGRAKAMRLLLQQLGSVQKLRGTLVFKRSEDGAAHDDLFFALGIALRAGVLAAPAYAHTYGAPGPVGAHSLSGHSLVGPESMRYLYTPR